MPKTKKSFRTQRRRIAAYGLLVLLVGLSGIAASGNMGNAEVWVFEEIYAMSDSLRWFALVATQLGNFWILIAVIGLLFVVRKNPQLALIVFRNSVLAYLATELLKFLVDRPRPMILLSDVTSREIAVFGNGFPSGHTALATVISLTIAPYLPRGLWFIPYVWIALVAWSRIYLGVHAPLDIVGGFIVGSLVVIVGSYLPWPRRSKR